MKLLKLFAFSLSILFLSISSSSAKDICRGEDVVLTWDSANVTSCTPGAPFGRGFNAFPNIASSTIYLNVQSTITVTLSCSNAAGDAASGSDTLVVKNANETNGAGQRCCTANQPCPAYDCPAPRVWSDNGTPSGSCNCPSGQTWNGSTCVAGAGVAAPTASLRVNNSTSVVVAAGDSLSYAWSSTNGVAYNSYYSSPSCGSGPWLADTANGFAGPYSAQANCDYLVTYEVTGAAGANPASASASVRVLVCAVGQTTNGLTCTTPVAGAMTGSITASPSTCTIASGASSCSSDNFNTPNLLEIA